MVYGPNDFNNLGPKIKVVGIGGGGGNAVNRMVENEVRGVEFVAINTDAQDLQDSKADIRIQIGARLTRGLGAGADPEVGRNAALESEDSLREQFKGTNLVFITAGMGGGTGTGAAPIVAKIAKECGALTIAIVTKPFAFEGQRRMQLALQGASELKKYVDSLIIIPNEKLISIADQTMTILDAFREADLVLRQAVQGISEIIDIHGLINVDFADVRKVMLNKGTALMGIGAASGEHRAVEAARKAIHSRLLEITLDGATDAIVNITSNEGITLFETTQCIQEIRHSCSTDLNIIYGAAINRKLKDELIVTVIATGYDTTAREAGIEDLTTAIFTEYSENQSRITKDGLVDSTLEDDIYVPQKNNSTLEQNDGKQTLPSWLKKKYSK